MKRLWDKINRTKDRWEWTAGKSRGYGHIRINGKNKVAHRVVYEILIGKIAVA